jgi:hypothetical protein
LGKGILEDEESGKIILIWDLKCSRLFVFGFEFMLSLLICPSEIEPRH